MDVLPAVRVELLCILWQAELAALAHSSSQRGMSRSTSHSKAAAGETGRKTSRVHGVGTATYFLHDRLNPIDLSFKQKDVSPCIKLFRLLSQRGSMQGTPDNKSHGDTQQFLLTLVHGKEAKWVSEVGWCEEWGA